MEKLFKIFPSIWLTLICCSLCALDSSAAPASHGAASSQDGEFKFPSAGTLSIDIVETPTRKDQLRILAQTAKLFKTRDFKGLDELGNKLSASKQSLIYGSWYVGSLFNGIPQPAFDDPDQSFEDQLKIMDDWAKQNPKSLIAKIAQIECWTGYAFKARGGGYANTVSQEGWKLFHERLERAEEIAREADKMPQTCPALYRAELALAIANQWDRDKMEAVFKRSVDKFPTYMRSYVMKYEYLTPKWNGKRGESEKFLLDSANKLGKGKESDKAYALLVWLISSNPPGVEENVFTTSPELSWTKAKAGFEELLKSHPNDFDVLSAYAKFADQADDKSAATALFNKIGNKCDQLVFGTKKSFAISKEHAFSSDAWADQNKQSKQTGQTEQKQ